MSRITGVTLVLIILVDNFCDSERIVHTPKCIGQGKIKFPSPLPPTNETQTKFHLTRVHIRECRCQVLSNGKRLCRSLRFPTNPDEKRDLIKCLCSQTNQRKFPELQAACRLWHPNISTPL